jgi:serine/threonine protein kinase
MSRPVLHLFGSPRIELDGQQPSSITTPTVFGLSPWPRFNRLRPSCPPWLWCNNQRALNKLQGQKVDKLLDENEYRVGEEPVPITDMPAMLDTFKVKRRLGTGSIVTVYLAHDPDSGRDVAVRLAKPEWLELVKRAAEIVARMAHPAIPEFYGHRETADRAYTVVEFVDGRDLQVILQEQAGFLSERDVVEWAVQICDALAYMHSMRPEPIIFRDMKPSSVMVDRNGKVYLTDLNIAEACQAGREQVAIGTEGYAPPEQYLGYTDARSDVYSLGATLHHLLTRRDPRQERVFSFHDAPPRSLNPAISEELDAVIMKAVEHNPENRYQSAEEMKAALLALDLGEAMPGEGKCDGDDSKDSSQD